MLTSPAMPYRSSVVSFALRRNARWLTYVDSSYEQVIAWFSLQTMNFPVLRGASC
ncbi:hypothetical protein L3055_00420 [Corynebacterium sp. MC-02]|uniref:hypothetical protein n=1 Tax=Corynebacterium pseudokroppenstedtii TaxID=2804917 RepID=UPI001F185BBF|nr:hypothetical protein [Corynebacterium pseudokroppenstedtii]MCF8702032.1 hypothetical protein [Corynebacterium pseudokroppenstedtii]MDU7504174.1 hypothetical protein [Corynebacterium kroppenstedtii]